MVTLKIRFFPKVSDLNWCSSQGRFLTAKRLHNTAQGRAAHPGRETQHTVQSTLKGLDKAGLTLSNPFRVGKEVYRSLSPRVRCATLGCVVQPLRGKEPSLGTTTAKFADLGEKMSHQSDHKYKLNR
jgi:hypothetical protein